MTLATSPHKNGSGAPLRVVVLVSGTGSLLQSILEAEAENFEVVKVVADVPCQGIERARARGVPTQIVEMESDRGTWDVRLAEAVAQARPDVVVSAGFMRILGPGFLALYKGRTINTHPALLPAFPGAHAVRDALAYGVKVTGSTVHFVDEGVDTGPIIAQRPVVVASGDDEATLHERIKQIERALIVEVLGALDLRGGELSVRAPETASPPREE